MAEDKSIDFWDYLLTILKYKKFLLILVFSVFLLSYGVLFFFVEPRYESSATIIPSDSDQFGGMASLLKGISNLPINLGALKKTSSVDMFNTIIFSRTNLEKVIREFGLYEEYELESMEKTVKKLAKDIFTEETKEKAFLITTRASSPEKAAKMTNFIVGLLNEAIIELNIKKARENREFLEHRYFEIKEAMARAEDSLRVFQSKTGLIELENQAKATIELYTKLESDLALKQVELSVLEKLYGENSYQSQNAKILVDEFKKKVNNIKSGTDKSAMLIPIESLPQNAISYLRLFRDVKIYETILEFIIPLYEQSKFEEQKEIPILQVIDYGVPPEKRAFPKRVLLSGSITIFLFILATIFIIIREALNTSSNPKAQKFRQEISNLFRFR